LLQQVADQRGVLLQAVLNVYLLGRFAGEGCDDFERVAQLLLVGLKALLISDIDKNPDTQRNIP
jgi:hypothetical protein